MRADDPRHSTYAGVQVHRRDYEELCGPCRAAQAEYQRNRRASDPRVRRSELRVQQARARALWRLSRQHRDEFQQLVHEELSKTARKVA